MDDPTHRKSFIDTMVVTWARRSGRRRLHLHGVAELNLLSQNLFSNVVDMPPFHNVALVSSLPHFFMKRQSLLRVTSGTRHTQITLNT